MNKKRLSTEDKIHIVSLFYGSSRDRGTRVSQSHIAKMYGKSRAAISKILRAEQVEALLEKTLDDAMGNGIGDLTGGVGSL